MKKTYLFAVKLLVSLFLLALMLHWANPSAFLDDLRHVQSNWFLAGCAWIVLVQVLKALRFQFIASLLNIRINLLRGLAAHFTVPIAGLVTPGKIGEGFKIFILGGPKKDLGFLFVFERVLDLLALLLVASFGLTLADHLRILYLFLLTAFLMALVVFYKLDAVLNWLTRVAMGRRFFEPNWAADMIVRLKRPGVLWTLPLTILVWAATFMVAYSFAKSVDIALTLPQVALVFAWGMIVGLVSGLPGGQGPRELTIAFLLHLFYQVPKSAGTALAILNLGAHYLVLASLAFIGWLMFSRTRDHICDVANQTREKR